MILRIRNEQGQFIDIPAIKGAKGDAFKFEDFTPEQLETLKGPAGADGKTPVRGIDYYTDEDVAYIINEVGTKINLKDYLTIAAAGETYLSKAEGYTRDEIDELIAEAASGGTIDFKDYLKKEEAKEIYVEKTITNEDGSKALIFNETDGGGTKFEGTETNSFVGVNDGSNNVDVLMYTINKLTKQGVRLIGNEQGLYYIKGDNLNTTEEDEVLTKKDLSSVGFIPFESGQGTWELADAAYVIKGSNQVFKYDNYERTTINNGGYLYITSDSNYKYFILIKNKETFFNIEYGRCPIDGLTKGTHSIFSTQDLIDLKQVVESTTLEII